MELDRTPQTETPYDFAWSKLPQLVSELETITKANSFADGTKLFLQSKTIWGLILLSIAYGLQKLHVLNPITYGEIYDQISILAYGIGLVLTAIGRIYATKKITLNRLPNEKRKTY